MKKWIGLLLVAAVVGAGWWFARTHWRVTPAWAQPKLGKVTTGDIRVPISAAGLIQPSQTIDIKSEAAGEIIEIPVVEGTYVRAGDKLVVLRKDDEQRRLDSSRAELDQRTALLKQAQIEVLRAKSNVTTAEARFEELEGQFRITEFDWRRVQEMQRAGQSSNQELNDAQARLDIVRAQLKAAQASIEINKQTVANAEANVEIQQAALRVAQTNVADAEERVRDTTVLAATDAIVTEVMVQKGMLVQSGTSGFTGGTLLMKLADVNKLKVLARLDEADYGRVQAIAPVLALPEMPGLRDAAAATSVEKSGDGTNGHGGLAIPTSAPTTPGREGKVEVTVDAFPDDKFAGLIERMEPQGKLNAGSSIIQFDVHVEITDDRRYRLPLGAQAQVEFTVEEVKNVLRVPSEAVKSHEGDRGVWKKVPPEPGTGEQFGKRFVRCRFGITDGENTEIVEVQDDEPLGEGTEVYTKLPQTAG